MGLVRSSCVQRRGLSRAEGYSVVMTSLALLVLGACGDAATVTEESSESGDPDLAFAEPAVSVLPGERMDLQVLLTDAQADPVEETSASELAWSSSDPDVATVESGELEAHEPGTARVTAEHPDGPRAGVDVEVQSGTGAKLIMSEDWSSGDFRQWDDGPSRTDTWNVVHDPSLAYRGEHVLEVEVPADQDAGYLGLFNPLAPGSREIYVRARIRLADGWDGFLRFFNVRASDPEHGEWPWQAMGGAGQCPQGDDRVRIGAAAWDEDSQSESTLRWYNYWKGMWPEPNGHTCWGRHSPDRGNRNAAHVSAPPRLPIGEWFTVELHAVLNDPGEANGSARMWLDGELKAHWAEEAWRSSEDLLFNIFQFDLRGRAPGVRHVYLDDIEIRSGLPSHLR